MIAHPFCLLQWEGRPWVPTTNGQDVPANTLIKIKLLSTANVRAWHLRVVGTDETIPSPSLSNVDATTNGIIDLTKEVTFESAGEGTAIIFESTTISITEETSSVSFGVYVLTQGGLRVGAAGETIEGDAIYGWTGKVNPLIRDWGKSRFNGIITEFNCTTQVELYDVVFSAGFDTVDRADARQIATTPVIGIVVERIAPLRVKVMHQGEFTGLTSLILGPYFLATSPGLISSVAPSETSQFVQVLGRATSPTRLVFSPAQMGVQLV